MLIPNITLESQIYIRILMCYTMIATNLFCITLIILNAHMMANVYNYDFNSTTCDCLNDKTLLCKNSHCICLPGSYGTGCEESCSCSENSVSAICDSVGNCECLSGYYGRNCDENCQCFINGTSNGNICDLRGYCDCKPGYSNKKCSSRCGCSEDGSLLTYCDQHGFCSCKPTYYGKKCQNACRCVHSNTSHCDDRGYCKCQPFYYGANCDLGCYCVNALSRECDHFGYCLCQTGHYGKICNLSCQCNNITNTGYCDINGYCECKPGFFGSYCNLTSPVCGTLYNSNWVNSHLILQKSRRIVNGQYSNQPIPWMVRFVKHGLHVCSGALLDNGWIITLQRCIGWLPDNDTFIVLGDYAQNYWDVQEREFKIHSLKIFQSNDTPLEEASHPILVKIGYLKTENMPYQFDAARRTELTYSSSIQAICLPNPQDIISSNDYAVLAGWGESNMYRRPSALQTSIFKLVEKDRCPLYKSCKLNTIFCAFGEFHNSFGCRSELGSPLTVSTNGFHKLIGLWLKGETNDCQRPHYNYFINISSYVYWINSNIYAR